MLLITLVSLKSSILFSQKVILDKSDTLICFTPVQCKVILKEIAKANYLDSLNKIQFTEIRILHLSISDLNEIILTQKDQLELSRTLSKLKDVQINQLQIDKKQLSKEVTRQKTRKVFAIIGGGITTCFMTYLWISK
jgi:hypothetical protein